MELINKQDAIKAIDDVPMEDEQYKVWLRLGIGNLKPVDAIPVKHGHWVGIDDEPYEVWECDMCGYIYDGDFVYNYCPHCGAKMDAE